MGPEAPLSTDITDGPGVTTLERDATDVLGVAASESPRAGAAGDDVSHDGPASETGADTPQPSARRAPLRIPRLPAIPLGRRRGGAPSTDATSTEAAPLPAATEATEATTTGAGPDDATDAPPSGRAGVLVKPRTDARVTDWVGRALDAYPRPAVPVAGHWDASVAGLVRQVPYVPRLATKPLELLDRFGALHVGPGEVGFDGDAVDWERVLEIRTQPAWSSLSADALEANFAQYLRVIPRLPGRGWVLGKVSELLVSLYLAVVPLPDDAAHLLELTGAPGEQTPGDEPAPQGAAFTRRTVTEIVYRRRFGEGEKQASTTAVLLQLAFPESTEAMLALAAEREARVVHVPVDEGEMGAAVRRAASWRSTALGLRERFARDAAGDVVADGDADRAAAAAAAAAADGDAAADADAPGGAATGA
ncbi:hypothetical protein [Oerskovia turbata]